MISVADRYDPVANKTYRSLDGQPLHDLSYYRGKWYLYFGITPAVLLFWPFASLTGHYLWHRDATLFFCSAGFMASAGLLWAVRRRYFPKAGGIIAVAGILAVGLASYFPIILSRCDVYEVALSSGYALVMLALCAVWRALHDLRRGAWWVALASLLCLSRQAETRFNYANLLLFGRGQPAQAAEQYRRVLAVWPDDAEVHNSFGKALAEQGKLSEAGAEFGRAIRLQPGYSEAHYNLANTRAAVGNFTEAVAMDGEALRLNPAFADAHFQSGAVRLLQGDAAGALPHLRAALEQAPDPADIRARLDGACASAEAAGHTNAVAQVRAGLKLRPQP